MDVFRITSCSIVIPSISLDDDKLLRSLLHPYQFFFLNQTSIETDILFGRHYVCPLLKFVTVTAILFWR